MKLHLCFAVAISLFLPVLTADAQERKVLRYANGVDLIADTSFREIDIASDFTGTQLAVFGTVDVEGAEERSIHDYDIVISIEGPREEAVVRRKERMVGIWANKDSLSFSLVPKSFLTLASKPIDQIADDATLLGHAVGLKRLYLGTSKEALDEGDSAAFRDAVSRLKLEKGLYSEAVGVEFLGQRLFRAQFSIPALIPIGRHVVRTQLFYKGELLGQSSNALTIRKVGFEQFMYNAAHNHGLLYGICAVLMAITLGWLGSVLFRRD